MAKWILSLFFIVSLSSCFDKQENSQALADSSLKTGNIMYGFLKGKQYDSVFALFSSSFFKKYSQQELQSVFGDIHSKYGTVVDFNLVETRTSITIKNSITEKTISNFYKVYYSSGFLAREELSFTFTDTTKKLNKVDGYTFDYFDPPDSIGTK